MSDRHDDLPSAEDDGAPGRGAPEIRRIAPATVLLAGGLFTLAAAVVVTAWVSDDALITLRTIDHLLSGRGLRFNALERVQAFTHPLWLFWVAPFQWVTGEGLWAPIAASLVCTAGSVALVLRVCGTAGVGGWVAVLALASSKSFVDYSTSGLENPLTHVLLALFALVWLGVPGGTRGDPDVTPWHVCILSLMTALVFTNRMDAVLLVAPAALWLAIRVLRAGRLSASLPGVVVGVAPALVWLAFAWLYYGSPWPNTAFSKLSTGIEREALLHQGLVYLRVFVEGDAPGALAMMAGCLLGAASPSARVRALAAGVPLYVAYVVWIGGDFMAGRFFSAPVFVAALLLGRSASDAQPASIEAPADGAGEGEIEVPREGVASPASVEDPVVGATPAGWPSRFGPAIAIAGAALAAFSPLSPLRVSTVDSYALIDPSGSMPEHGVVDERLWYYTRTGALSAHREGGLEPGASCQGEPRVLVRRVCGGLGRIAFEGCAGDHWIDPCGLTDAFIARRPIPEQATWRIGHFMRAVPRGYRESVVEGRPLMGDATLDAQFERTLLRVRAPVFDAGRLREIVLPGAE